MNRIFFYRNTLTLALLLAFGSSVAADAPAAKSDDDADLAPAAAPRKATAKAKKVKSNKVTVKVDRLRAETGWFIDSAAPSSNNYLHGAASVNIQPDRTWEFQLGARFDGQLQTGTPDAHSARLDYTENFVRWRGEGTRFTFGTQNIAWGRTDEFPPTDRLSRADLSRFPLDGLSDRRRAVPALRLEKFIDEFKLDAVWVPDFRPAELAATNSVWNPVDRTRGRILGVEPTPDFTYLIQHGGFAEDKRGAGGGGLRLTQTGGGVDWGLSLQRARQSAPYYQINPQLRGTLLAGGGAAAALAASTGPAFTAVHPMSTVAGAELEFQRLGATWRIEATRSSDNPATTQDLRYLTVPAWDIVAGAEFFPGDAETRVTLQLASHSLRTNELLIDRKIFNAFTGDIEHPFAGGRWRANMRFLTGLNHRDNYVNPKLTYTGFDSQEIYIGAHFFGGDNSGTGGYHRDHDLVTVGWQAKY